MHEGFRKLIYPATEVTPEQIDAWEQTGTDRDAKRKELVERKRQAEEFRRE